MVSGLPTNRKPRRKPGPAPKDDDEIRATRITIRAHQDLEKLLTLRADEAGVSRSHYIERLLIRWLTADPRNPGLDAMGRIKTGGTTPFDMRHKDPLKMAERWQRFAAAHEVLFSMRPPQDLFEDPDSYWPAQIGGHVEPHQDSDLPPEDREPADYTLGPGFRRTPKKR
jgi:hypothetical protein